MRNVYWLLLAVVIGCLAGVSAAQRDETLYDSGNAFARECSPLTKQTTEMTNAEINSTVKCAMYVRGLFDGVKAERIRVLVLDPTKVSPAFFCEDSFNDTENGQVVRILLKYIRNNPEKADQPVGALFMFAMRDAFPPCPDKK